MFQPWFVELMSVIKDILVGLSAIIVAVLGFLGLRQWRAEMTGRAKFEVARRAMLLALRFRDEFRWARGIYAGGGGARLRGEDETPEQRQILDEQYARRERLKPLRETLLELRQVRWEAKVILGDDLQEWISPLEGAWSELQSAIEMYFQQRLESLKPLADRTGFIDSSAKRTADRMIELMRVIESYDDDLSKSVDAAVDALEQELVRHLR